MTENSIPLVIVNPRSGGGTSEQQWASMTSVIRANLGPFDCEFTKSPNDATKIAGVASRKGRRLIIALGGDGTISEVANGILESGRDAELGILPRGTGGDFRRTLQIPADLAGAARRIREGSARRMDAGRIEFVNSQGEQAMRYFINTASFGMSGRVARRANQSSKRLGGTLTYVAATVGTLIKYDYPEVSIEIDNAEPRRLRILTVCVANGPAFGGGMKIAPGAKLNDGLFNVVLIGPLKIPQLLFNSYRLYNGSVLSIDQVAHIPAKKVRAAAVNAGDVLLEVDGETPGRLPATFEILPSALTIRC